MKKKILVLAALVGSMTLPAFAQSEMTTSQTNLDQRAAAQERRAASAKGQLSAVTADQARTNGLQRCANLPAFYKVDCESRVNGQGAVSGSVVGGGLIKESVTQVSPDELRNAPRIELKPQPEPPMQRPRGTAPR
ncbi:MAG: hypothetical protein I8H77_02395 [Comamonadaceae bacterium]|nr:hypothetical protein [Comamonadaceae bacterium]